MLRAVANRVLHAVEILREPREQAVIIRSITVVLLGFGLISVFSASSVESLNMHGSTWFISLKQVAFAAVGVFAMFWISKLPTNIVRVWAPRMMLVALGMLVLVLIVGRSVNGQRNWIPLGPVSIQPSEFAKMALVFWAAHVVSDAERRGINPIALGKQIIGMGVIVLGFIAAEGDMGNVMVIGGIIVGLLFTIGFPGRALSALTAVGIVGIALVLVTGPAYRFERIKSWLDPMRDPEGYGWQFIHGTYALAVGGMFGQGPGASKEKWGALPEAHTDFILAVIGEEYGFVGTAVTLCLFALLIIATFRVARLSTTTFNRVASAGVGTWLLIQSMFNVGAVVGFLPIVGVTLPFVSYGGSSLLPLLLAMGVVLRFASEFERPRAKVSA